VELEQNRKTGGGRERNDRVVAVPAKAPRLDVDDVARLPDRVRAELERFFLEVTFFEEKDAVILGWKGPEAAWQAVRASLRTLAELTMAYRIKDGEAVSHAVARMARAELTGAAESISSGRTATDRVHDMRTSLKKTRALLRLVKPSVGRPARRENRRLRDVARAVAGFRDADVVLDTFDRLAAAVPASKRPRLARPRQRLAAQLRAQKQQLFADGKDDALRAPPAAAGQARRALGAALGELAGDRSGPRRRVPPVRARRWRSLRVG
jgi:hypothetical protein